MVPCRPTLLYKRDYVENSTVVISLIDYKDRDKFPFYPNNTPESLSKATKIPSMWYLVDYPLSALSPCFCARKSVYYMVRKLLAFRL